MIHYGLYWFMANITVVAIVFMANNYNNGSMADTSITIVFNYNYNYNHGFGKS